MKIWLQTALLLTGAAALVQGQINLSFALPERIRLLEDQRIDLVVEARYAAGGTLRVTANGVDISSLFKGPQTVDLDCVARGGAVWRAEMISFATAGVVRLEAALETAQGVSTTVSEVMIQPFKQVHGNKNVILYIGDGMTESWRDAARIVGRSVETIPGVPGLRQGFYDRLLEMDRMPVAGTVMNHSIDKVIPDSAPTAHALATGSKTFDGAVGALPDGTDCHFGTAATEATLRYAMDNPRVENIAEYLKRRFGYRIGIVTTSSVADATPTAFGAHTGDRDTAFAIVSQFLENPFLNGEPAADVLMGGGGESFDPAIRPDGKDVFAAFRAKGYHVVRTATEMKGLDAASGKVLGIYKALNTTVHSSRVRASSTSHMNVAYDKLKLTRPGSEPLPEFNGWTDQPFLDDMTAKAIEILAGPDGKQPFFLMVEAASIDKQSHSGHFAGALWDTLEFDKAIGVGRAWAAARKSPETLMVVTADHGQPMHIIGVGPISDADYFDRTSNLTVSMTSPVGTHSMRVYKDINHNARAMVPWGSAGGKSGPPAEQNINVYGYIGFPNYIDADGDGYPENREAGGKGNVRLAVGFRTGNHTGMSMPLMAEGPGALLFTGTFDQTEVPQKIAAALASNTVEMDKLLERVTTASEFPRTPGK